MSAEKMAKMCFSKKRYSERVANEVVRKAKDERNVDLRIYRCPMCMGLHVTKQYVNKFEKGKRHA